jgi:hypothetical protein
LPLDLFLSVYYYISDLLGESQMNTAQNISIYINNFDTQNPGPATNPTLQQLQQYATDINGSGFTTGILWALHINAEGDFIYNGGAPMISGGQLQSGLRDLQGLLSSIKTGGMINKLLFSTGGWTCESDFVNIGNLIQQYGTGSENPLYRNFQALKSQLFIDGIDLDLEADSSPSPYSHPYDYYTDTVVQLTQMLSSLGMETTFCPYTAKDFWLGCLAQVYQNNNQQLVGCLNLQCYDGGARNTQSEWVGYIQQYGSNLGIGDPAAFVVPGFDASTCPSELESLFSNSKIMAAGIQGGFVWNYSEILGNQGSGTCAPNNSTADYASDIVNGIAKLGHGAQEQSSNDSPQHMATLTLPKGGMEAWTLIMQGQSPVPNDINPGSPIVMAYARYDDGTQVAGGVYKWENPAEYNVKFMWVFDSDGNQYQGNPIDVSDDQDFLTTTYIFSLTENGEDYQLNIADSTGGEGDNVPEELHLTTENSNNYTFNFSLLNEFDPGTGLQPRYSATLNLNTNDPTGITGTIAFNGYFTKPIDVQGTAAAGYLGTGTLINVSGSSSEAQVNLAFIITPDGSAGGGDDTLLGGTATVFDINAEETTPYIIQGVAPQFKFARNRYFSESNFLF